MINLAYVISPHGFGHAARACAVMEAMLQLNDQITFHIFTSIGRWFFEECLDDAAFIYTNVETDIGLIQSDPVTENVSATLSALQQFYPLRTAFVESVASALTQNKCSGVLCDIAPLGIAAAEAASLPSFLIENFTWDFIYRNYLEEEPRLAATISHLTDLFDRATYHIQITPACNQRSCDYVTSSPVTRQVRNERSITRRNLRCPPNRTLVLITMGGTPASFPFLVTLAQSKAINFVIPGASSGTGSMLSDNIQLLPRTSDFYHPDLVNAADIVLGKLGYSTVSEIAQSRTRFGYLTRPRFPESPFLEAYVNKYGGGLMITPQELNSSELFLKLDSLAQLPTPNYPRTCGAEEVAHFILEHI